MTRIWIKISLISIFSLLFAQCAGNGAVTSETVISDPGAAPVIPAPIPAPVPAPDPEPGPVEPDLMAPAISASEGRYADRIEISWQPIPGASYKLYRKLESANSYTLIYTGAEPFYNDITATAWHSYQYAVKAANAQGHTSVLSDFDAGWRAHSEGCAAKLNGIGEGGRIGLFRKGFRDASAIAIRGNHFYIAGGGRIVMLNAQRDLVGLWTNAGTISAMTTSATGETVYALAGKQILKLTEACGLETFAVLPNNTQGFDITLDTSGNLYVSEQSSQKTPRVFRYAANGNLINEWEFPNGSMFRSLNTIHWISENALLVADRTMYKIFKYRIEGNQLVKAAEKAMPVIGEPTDIATQGNNILLFTKANGTMHLTRYHSGFDGGSVTYDIGFNYRMHVTEAAVNPANGTLYATDETGRQLLACSPPLFTCAIDSAGIAPVGIATDATKNLYVLHGAPTGVIAKLNTNGAQLGARILPDYQNRAVTPYGVEADGDSLYISATNGQKALVLKLKNDLSGAVTFTERAGNGQAFFDVAASAGRIVSEQRVDFTSGDDYLTKAVFEAWQTDGSKVQLPEYILPAKILMPLASKIEACGPASLYYQVSGFGNDLQTLTQVARLSAGQENWLEIALPAAQFKITEVRCAKMTGTLFSLDTDTGGNMSVAQRDTALGEVRRFGSARSLIGKTFTVAGDGSAGYAASAQGIHRFAPAQISLGAIP